MTKENDKDLTFKLGELIRPDGRKPDQIRETAQASDLVLEPETIEALTEATEEVKRLLGTSPDIWGGKAEARFR